MDSSIFGCTWMITLRGSSRYMLTNLSLICKPWSFVLMEIKLVPQLHLRALEWRTMTSLKSMSSQADPGFWLSWKLNQICIFSLVLHIICFQNLCASPWQMYTVCMTSCLVFCPSIVQLQYCL